MLFQPASLGHPNGATGIVTVAAVAETPSDFRGFLAAATGRRKPPRTTSDGIAVKADGKSVLVLTPDAFRARYDVAPPNPRRGMLFAAFELQVLELERAAGYAGPDAKRSDERIVVPPRPGLSAVVTFRSGKANG